MQEEEAQPLGLATTDWLQSPAPSTPAVSPQSSPGPLSENTAAVAAAQNRENLPDSTAGKQRCLSLHRQQSNFLVLGEGPHVCVCVCVCVCVLKVFLNNLTNAVATHCSVDNMTCGST